MEYSKRIMDELERHGISVGDHVIVEKDSHSFEGILMPKSQGDANSLIIKMSNGYNMGIDFSNAKIRKTSGQEFPKKSFARPAGHEHDPSKPTITIIGTGGTIASRIDYKTGAVSPLESAEELIAAIPELRNIANVRMRTAFQMASDDMKSQHWMALARKIDDEIHSGVDGIIVTHGTDTMHYTSAALSFMIQNLPVPVLIVGSQRSSDRGSSDAAFNLLCAAQFIAKSDFSGVAICMHGSPDDKFCHIHQGTHAKKMHTSRRDTFRSIDVLPYAKVEPDGTIEYLRTDYAKKDKTRIQHLSEKYRNNVALVKIHPGFDYRVLEFYEKHDYRGIVLEGTGLGHAPINHTDDATRDHPMLLETIRRMTTAGILIGMTSQCTYGKVNMNVYSPARTLQEAGVLPLYMTPETAMIKMGWSLGHSSNPEEAKAILLKDVAGEFVRRIDPQAFEQ